VLGKHSGRHALKQRCEQLGYSLSKRSWTMCTATSRPWRIVRKDYSTRRSSASSKNVVGAAQARPAVIAKWNLNILVLPATG